MKTRESFIFGLMLSAATALHTLILYPQLPSLIPIHWGWRGEINGWGEKWWAAWMMPGVMLLLLGMQILLPVFSSSKFSVESFRKTFDHIMLSCTALMGYIHVVMLQSALRPTIDSGRILMIGLLLFFSLTGNVIGRIHRNQWMGIRTPWTMASDAVWTATHRLAGYLMTAAGLFGAFALWIGAPFAISVILLLIAVLVPVAYSFILYRKIGGSGA